VYLEQTGFGTGAAVGRRVGALVGRLVGALVGAVGRLVGALVGALVGLSVVETGHADPAYVRTAFPKARSVTLARWKRQEKELL
jgi:uncharacterized protein YqgC (DUF456 family)